MKTLWKAKLDLIEVCGPIDPESDVIIHNGVSDDHDLGPNSKNCWCQPIVMTGKQFKEVEFIY